MGRYSWGNKQLGGNGHEEARSGAGDRACSAHAGDGSGQAGRPEDLDLAAAGPSAGAGDQGHGPTSIEKASNGTIKTAIFPSEQLGKAFDHYDMARDGIADLTYVNPGYQPGRFPIIAVGQMPFTFADAKKGTAALDAWYRKHAATEMKDTHFCFAFIHDPGDLSRPQEGRGARGHQGHEDPAGAEHDRPDGDHAGRHQRAGLGAGGARRAGARRRRRHLLPVGLDVPVRPRQGHQVPHRRAALLDRVHLLDEQGQVRRHVAGAEEGDRRPLHDRMGGEASARRGTISRRPAAPR